MAEGRPAITEIWVILVDTKLRTEYGRPFLLRMHATEYVYDMKEKIKDKKSNDLADVDANNLRLWKPKIPLLRHSTGSEETSAQDVCAFLEACPFPPSDSSEAADVAIKADGPVRLLDEAEKMSKLFQSDPENRVQVIAQRPGSLIELLEAAKKQLDAEIKEGRTTPRLPLAQQLRKKNLDNIASANAGLGHVSDFKTVEELHKLLFTGRIKSLTNLPVSLYHCALATLQHELETLDDRWMNAFRRISTAGEPREGLIEIDPVLYDASKAYVVDACAFYPKEDKRKADVFPFFEKVMGGKDRGFEKERRTGELLSLVNKNEKPSKVEAGERRADAIWGSPPRGILEMKNESGIGGDANLQALNYFAGSCQKLLDKYPHSKFPTILLGVAGNVIEIWIAVCLEQVIASKVLTFSILPGGDNNSDETTRKLSLIALALKKCSDELEVEYRQLNQESRAPSPSSRSETWHLPCPTIISSDNTTKLELSFKSKLTRTNEDCAAVKTTNGSSVMRTLFLADYTTEGLTKDTVVKFVPYYNKDAHERLAEAGLAPALYACEPVIGGWVMVLMERLDTNLKQMRHFAKSLPFKVFTKIGNALQILHCNGLVFGDLRNTNILVAESGNGEFDVKLVDFDWVAEERRGIYPSDLNPELINIKDPGRELGPDVAPMGLMEKKHDIWALERLIEKHCANVDETVIGDLISRIGSLSLSKSD